MPINNFWSLFFFLVEEIKKVLLRKILKRIPHNEKEIAVPKEKLIYVERFFFSSFDAVCRLNKIISLFIEGRMQGKRDSIYIKVCISKGLESISIRIFSQIMLLRDWLAHALLSLLIGLHEMISWDWKRSSI